MIAKMSIDPLSVPRFSLRDGVVRKGTQIWIGDNCDLQQRIRHAVHSSALRGHSGFPATYLRLKKMFYWRRMKSAVRSFIQSCITCQQAKPDRSRLPGLLQPLPVPDSTWQIISMDFVEGLPRSGNANCILVVVDSYTKYGHFLPLLHPFTAASVAKVFLNNIYRLHGLPSAIVSDRDHIFTCQFWKELFVPSGRCLPTAELKLPSTVGWCLNQTMETFLRCFVNACPAKWSSWLALAEF